MTKLNVGTLFHLAWKVLGHLPGPLVRGIFAVAADVTWLRRTAGVKQLERNYARVRPGMDERRLRQLSRAGMRSYMRYYAEAFTLRAATHDQIDARVRMVGFSALSDHRDAGRSVVAALGHLGNWDLAGAFSGLRLMPVLTIAERLEPPKLFEEFLEFREQLGMKILALGDDGVFSQLMRGAKSGPWLICLLADRDLTANGIEVDMFGERARVAAGPAALAAATGAPLVSVAIHYERLSSGLRRRAGTPWGIVIEFMTIEPPAPQMPRKDRLQYYTQAWVDSLSQTIARHPEDWHMLQKVFIADLDPTRYAQTVSGENE